MMTTNTAMRGRDTAMALLVTVVWGLNFLVIREGLGSMPPFLFAGLRFALVAFPAIFFVGRGGLTWGIILATGSLLGVGYFTLLFLGMQLGMPPGLSSLVSQGQVLFTALLSALWLRQSPTFWQWAGMAVAMTGLVCAGYGSLEHAPLAGFLLVLTGALCWGVGNLAVKRLGTAGRVDGFRLTIWMSLVPPLPNLCLSAWLETGQMAVLSNLVTVSGGDWAGLGAVLYTAWGSTIFGWGAWAWLLRRYAAPQVAPFSLMVPAVTMLASGFLGIEAFDAQSALSSSLLLGGVALTVLGDRLGARLARLFSWRDPSLLRPAAAVASPRPQAR